ncbi:MAG: PTS fructose transporter subunit IIA [Gammaproteobacteria bacterium]|nr:PTS fructose transporter subunit IIA [Gammaproteobacteria bacterium]MDD9807396.1 PTS fructose transporter subunit IIA [Gammaproteobacteria bacterium]MDD9886168.1 PTS fructose transporter subunit IIA [Gammaproteobacteria bacterium]
MSTAILLVTHDKVGEDLLAVAAEMVRPLPTDARALSVPFSCIPDETFERMKRMCDDMDGGDGVLVLADLYGATPCNIATRLCGDARRRVVSGLNLPMLLRAINYCGLGVGELAAKAAEGGHSGVVEHRS